jgi:death-on-curing protein
LSIIPLTVEDIIILHENAIQQTGGSSGVLNRGNLESCCKRLTNTFYGIEQFPSIFQKAAALMECINSWHIFVDGNKRTALQAVHLFLDFNGWEFKPDNNAVSISVNLAKGNYNIVELEAWIQRCSTPTNRYK